MSAPATVTAAITPTSPNLDPDDNPPPGQDGLRPEPVDRPYSQLALGLGPLSVLPDRQKSGIGSALVHAVLGAADALDERLVGLLGEPAYYRRFGFVPAESVGISAPEASWGDYFQVRTLTQYDGQTGRFRYAAPFDRL